MGCTIVVGGQYGSEGKGKVVALTAAKFAAPLIVRCGGPNSGHTVRVGGAEVVLRQVPAGAGHPSALLMLAAGCAVDADILVGEADRLGLPRERVIVDPRAVLVTNDDRAAETDAGISIGSTSSGTGAALARRMSRARGVQLVQHSDLLRARVRIEAVAPLLHECIERGGDVVVEGTQGFGLSLFHGFDYPYVTARDTTAAGFASEVGVSPRHIDSITMVIRTFPIRVGGNSGPFPNEIDWETVRALSGAPEAMPEFTSVTRKLRRVARFDKGAVVSACRYNRPTSLAVMGIDRLDYQNSGVKTPGQLSRRGSEFLRTLADETRVPVEWVGTGFGSNDAIKLRSGNDG